jgi:hypothetical protein
MRISPRCTLQLFYTESSHDPWHCYDTSSGALVNFIQAMQLDAECRVETRPQLSVCIHHCHIWRFTVTLASALQNHKWNGLRPTSPTITILLLLDKVGCCGDKAVHMNVGFHLLYRMGLHSDFPLSLQECADRLNSNTKWLLPPNPRVPLWLSVHFPHRCIQSVQLKLYATQREMQ